jgi:hypothetical protein
VRPESFFAQPATETVGFWLQIGGHLSVLLDEMPAFTVGEPLLKGAFLKWNDAARWQDRDGLTPPSPLLVIAVTELLQKWKDGKAETITEKPLPSVESLNSAIPQQEWEKGIDGAPRKPWQHTIAVYLVSPATGELFTYMAATVGAHIAYDALKEAVITMRALRGSRVMPLVNLTERTMKTKFGTKLRPHFKIIDWKTPGDDARAIPAKATPRLAAPEAKPKPAVKPNTETLDAMADVKPLTSQEIFNDKIGF